MMDCHPPTVVMAEETNVRQENIIFPDEMRISSVQLSVCWISKYKERHLQKLTVLNGRCNLTPHACLQIWEWPVYQRGNYH